MVKMKVWRGSEITKLKFCISCGLSAADCADRLPKRSEQGVRNVATRLGLKFAKKERAPKPKTREEIEKLAMDRFKTAVGGDFSTVAYAENVRAEK